MGDLAEEELLAHFSKKCLGLIQRSWVQGSRQAGGTEGFWGERKERDQRVSCVSSSSPREAHGGWCHWAGSGDEPETGESLLSEFRTMVAPVVGG